MLLQQITNGITIGGTYVLVSIGLTLIFGILLIPNLAHGQMLMLGAFVTYTLISALGLNLFVAIVLATVIVGVVGIGVERLAFRPLANSLGLTLMVSALAVSMLLESGATLVWGGNFQVVRSPFESQILKMGDISISYTWIFVLGVTILLVIAVYLFLNKTRFGAAMRAMADNRMAAQLMGVNTDRVAAVTAFLSAGLASIAGSMMALLFPINTGMGGEPVLKAFAVIVLGGIGNVTGAVLGALFLGIIESLLTGYVSSVFTSALAFVVLVTVLVIRPTGLLGEGSDI